MLKVLSADKAQLFGLPAQDMDEATALQWLAAQGFDERAAREHLREAIGAGAFEVKAETSARAAAKTPKGDNA